MPGIHSVGLEFAQPSALNRVGVFEAVVTIGGADERDKFGPTTDM